MFSRSKIQKENPSDLEDQARWPVSLHLQYLGNPCCEQVAQAFVDLEINNEALRPTLKNLEIVSALEINVNSNSCAIVVFLPFKLRELFRSVQVPHSCVRCTSTKHPQYRS